MNQNHIVRFENPMGLSLTSRLVTKGMGYGRWHLSGGWALAYDRDEPLVEFYDERFASRPGISHHGQFISRYRLETLAESSAQSGGLCLDGGVRDWDVSHTNLQHVLSEFGRTTEAMAQLSERLGDGLRLKLGGLDPDTPRAFGPEPMLVSVPSLYAASAVSRQFLDVFSLNAGSWAGGEIINSSGLEVAWVSYDGHVHEGDLRILEAASPDEFPRITMDQFFAMAAGEVAGSAPLRERVRS